MARLGAEATEMDAARIEPHLSQAYPGVDPADMPDETFFWLREGCGRPPVVCVVPPSATSLLGLYVDMTDTGRGKLLEHAKAIAMADNELKFADTTI